MSKGKRWPLALVALIALAALAYFGLFNGRRSAMTLLDRAGVPGVGANLLTRGTTGRWTPTELHLFMAFEPAVLEHNLGAPDKRSTFPRSAPGQYTISYLCSEGEVTFFFCLEKDNVWHLSTVELAPYDNPTSRYDPARYP